MPFQSTNCHIVAILTIRSPFYIRTQSSQTKKFTKPEDARHLAVDSQVIAAIPAVIDCIDRRLIPTVESRGNNAQGFPRSQYYGNI